MADITIAESPCLFEDSLFSLAIKISYIDSSKEFTELNIVSFGFKFPSLLNNALVFVLLSTLETPYKAPRIGLSLSFIFSNTGNKLSLCLDSIAVFIDSNLASKFMSSTIFVSSREITFSIGVCSFSGCSPGVKAPFTPLLTLETLSGVIFLLSAI